MFNTIYSLPFSSGLSIAYCYAMTIRRAKRILLCAMVVYCIFLGRSELCHAIDYYFSGAGSDTLGNGTLGSPWQSIAKFNTLDLNAGDNVYFRAGDTFMGNILLDATDSANSAVGEFGGFPLTL